MESLAPTTIGTLDALDPSVFESVLAGLFEHSPWIVGRVAAGRPFGSARGLHDALMRVVDGLTPDEQLGLIQAHPDLAGQEAAEHRLTEASAGEQGRLGFTALGPAEHQDLAALNASYRARFGFPCVIALARHASRDSVVAEFRARLGSDAVVERAAALEAIGQITRARLAQLLGLAGGSLSIHALDTSCGQPGAHLAFELLVREAGAWRRLLGHETDERGRTARPLLSDIDMAAGSYRLDFHVGDYHRSRGVPCGEPAFFDVVPIVFGIAHPGEHHHVPLLFSPWSYSTYRGS